MKTVLAPGAPWPTHYDTKAKKRRPLNFKPLALPSDGLDFFAEAREQIATGAARRKASKAKKS